MRFRVEVMGKAGEDAIAVRRWYQRERTELAEDFVDALEGGFAAIADRATMYPVIRKDIRRLMLKSFPYHIMFRVVGDTAFVIAIIHERRDPAIWHKRT
jgi:toxin ParE1/3/4